MYPEVHTLADANLCLEWCGGTMLPKKPHQRPRIIRVLAESPVGRSPCLDRQVLWSLPCMRLLSELAHVYTTMGVLGPIYQIGR